MRTQAEAAEASSQVPRIISRRQFIERSGLSDTTVWRLVRRGDLPPPVHLSPGRVGWPESVIIAWLQSRGVTA